MAKKWYFATAEWEGRGFSSDTFSIAEKVSKKARLEFWISHIHYIQFEMTLELLQSFRQSADSNRDEEKSLSIIKDFSHSLPRLF